MWATFAAGGIVAPVPSPDLLPSLSLDEFSRTPNEVYHSVLVANETTATDLNACFEKCRDFNGESLSNLSPTPTSTAGHGRISDELVKHQICGAELKTKDMV
jgi:hypothetical protein